jgi:hypothetical protein
VLNVWDAFWDWFTTGENGFWVILGIFGIRFLIRDVPKAIYMWKNTSPYGDDDPSGNDNVGRKPYDYM